MKRSARDAGGVLEKEFDGCEIIQMPMKRVIKS
jgi:hypothetical protein